MIFAHRNKPKYSDLALIAENLGMLYRDGISITKSLELLLELPISAVYKKSIFEIHKKVTSGESLSAAFSYYDSIYPKFYLGLLSVGENSGKLPRILSSLSNYYGKIDKAKKEVINALIYPSILVIAMIALATLLILFIVPTFYDIYVSMDREIPKSSEILYMINENIRTKPIESLLYLICWGVFIPYVFIRASGPFIKENIISKLKIVKAINEYIYVLILAVIAESGISLQVGLRYCIDSVTIPSVKKGLLIIYKDILMGKELSTSMDDIKTFSKYTLSIVKLGEESGSMEERLIYLEKRINEKSMDKLQKALAYVQPTLILSMALAVGIFIIIFITPLFESIYSGVA